MNSRWISSKVATAACTAYSGRATWRSPWHAWVLAILSLTSATALPVYAGSAAKGTSAKESGKPELATSVSMTSLPHRFLFLDPALVEIPSSMSLRVHPPRRAETVILPDKPWEQLMISFFLTVRKEGDKFRMWYICRDKEDRANLAYAESTDGIHWQKPNLGIKDYDGNRDNNLVGIGSLEGVVFTDPNTGDSERYQYVTPGRSKNGIQLFRYHSPDGLHWKRDPQGLIDFGSDTQNVSFWDPSIGKYVIYMRGWNPSPNRRKVVRTTLDSLTVPLGIHPAGRGWKRYVFDEMPTVLVCDEKDPELTDIYNMSAQPYPLDPKWYVAFPTFFRRFPQAENYRGRDIGRTEIQFVGSRDGIDWQRYDRASYVKPETGKNMVFMGTGMIPQGDEIWQYATEFHSFHGDVAARQKKTDGIIVRFVQRVDGFVSLHAGEVEGTATTALITVSGPKLLANIDAGALGDVRIGFVDDKGKPIDGYSIDDCVRLGGNHTGAVVHFGEEDDVSSLVGRQVRVQIRARRADVYSIRFE